MMLPEYIECRLMPCPQYRETVGDLFDGICDCGWDLDAHERIDAEDAS